MEVLQFRLRGETAFFKIPEVNSYSYFTYSSIHKVALLGILGSVVGCRGYSIDQEGTHPEFYEKLKDIKCSIEIDQPLMIKKKFQQFNNSVGYASFEDGGNLIVTEQWIEKPVWNISILVDSIPEGIPLVDYLLNRKAVYIPYLGKNDHFATIEDCELVEARDFSETEYKFKIRGIFEDEGFSVTAPVRGKSTFYKHTERLPRGLDRALNQYELSEFTQTNGDIQVNDNYEDLRGELKSLDTGIYYFV